MKKICFITTVPLTIECFLLKLLEYIHYNTDWDINIICDYDKTFKDNLPEYIHYYPVKMKRGISISGIRAMVEILKIFKKEHFDLIQYSTPNASLYAAMAGKISKIPVRLYCQWGLAYVGFVGIKRKIFKWIEKIVCKLSNYIEPDSNSNLEFAYSEKLYSKEKGKVIWNGSACGVNLEKFNIKNKYNYRNEIRAKYKIDNNAIVYGFVGRVTRDKGINELFEAFKRRLIENKNIYLFIVGNPDGDDTVDQNLYQWAKCEKNIIFTGFSNEVEKYFSAMDIYILPSYREGFGMGIVEAEAMGLPVIVTDIPGPTDAMIANKTGLIVKKRNKTDLEEAMIKLEKNKDLREEFSNYANQFAKDNFEQTQLFKYIFKDRKELIERNI